MKFDNNLCIDLVMHNTENGLKFVIKNKECKINGYNEKWSLKCDLCEQKCYDEI